MSTDDKRLVGNPTEEAVGDVEQALEDRQVFGTYRPSYLDRLWREREELEESDAYDRRTGAWEYDR